MSATYERILGVARGKKKTVECLRETIVGSLSVSAVLLCTDQDVRSRGRHFVMCRRNESPIVDPSILIEAAVLAYHIPKQLGHDLTSPAAAAVRDMRSKPALSSRPFPLCRLDRIIIPRLRALGSPNNAGCFAISFDRLPEHGPNSRRLHFRQIARILAARSPTLVRQSGTAAVSLSLPRPATTFCIIAINRFCSALLRPSSVS